MSESIQPSVPFIWPEPRVSAGVAPYASLPFEEVARSAVSIFGVVSAIDRQAVDWMEGYLADGARETRLRLVISIQPTCRTTEADLLELVRLSERYPDRAAFRIYPEQSLRDRSSNLLCFSARDASVVVALGPAENMGLGPTSASQANIVTSVSPSTLEACRKWFDYLWAVAGPLQPEIAAAMPQLVIPEGEAEATRLWKEYRNRCLTQPQGDTPQLKVTVDAVTGDVTLTDQKGEPVASPTEELGVRSGADGLSWSSADLQEARWDGYGPPGLLYRKLLPDAAMGLAKSLPINAGSVRLRVRTGTRAVGLGTRGWEVRSQNGCAVTKPFDHRGQAERFADLTGEFAEVDMPALWFDGLGTITAIPLYGAGVAERWTEKAAPAS